MLKGCRERTVGQSIAAAGCKKRKWGNHKFTQICKCPRLLARSVCAIEWECVCLCLCGCVDCCTCVCTWQRVPPLGLPNQQTLQQGETNRSSGTTARKCSRPKGNLVELSAPVGLIGDVHVIFVWVERRVLNIRSYWIPCLKEGRMGERARD